MIIGAVLGGQHEILAYILSFKYKAWDDEDIHKLNKMLLMPDIMGNTALHYAYSYNLPKMRDMLRGYDPEIKKEMICY